MDSPEVRPASLASLDALAALRQPRCAVSVWGAASAEGNAPVCGAASVRDSASAWFEMKAVRWNRPCALQIDICLGAW